MLNKKPRNRNNCFYCEHFEIVPGCAVCKCGLDKKEIPYKEIGPEPPLKCPYLKQQYLMIYRKKEICAKCDYCVGYGDFIFGGGKKSAYQCLIYDNIFLDFETWEYCEVDKRCLFYAEYLMEEINEDIS